jgi:hypothetical protein
MGFSSFLLQVFAFVFLKTSKRISDEIKPFVKPFMKEDKRLSPFLSIL